jgi:predicted small metal-binding protein
MTCADLGGPCKSEISASTSEEMIEKGMEHLAEVHPEMAMKVHDNTKEENDKWTSEFLKKWETTPESPA